jgi:hypothetical protein
LKQAIRDLRKCVVEKWQFNQLFNRLSALLFALTSSALNSAESTKADLSTNLRCRSQLCLRH